jgi:hypothetical protein
VGAGQALALHEFCPTAIGAGVCPKALSSDAAWVNVDAIALGHPIRANGARILVTLVPGFRVFCRNRSGQSLIAARRGTAINSGCNQKYQQSVFTYAELRTERKQTEILRRAPLQFLLPMVAVI